MRYIIDHDLHNHSYLSPCSRGDSRQTREAIFAYGMTNGYKLLALTDHGWDDKVDDKGARGWHANTMNHLRENLPLPQAKDLKFILGCEIDMNRHGIIGLSPEEQENFEYFIISVSHLNLTHFTIDPEQVGSDAASRKEYYKMRLHMVLENDSLPFHKIGLAHFTTGNICNADLFGCISLFTDEELREIFSKVAARGIGVELNFPAISYNDEQLAVILRPFRTAKECGCKFYLGGDSHNPEPFRTRKQNFEKIIDLLELEESDKWEFVIRMIESLGE